MAVTDDKYELPLALGGTQSELARLLGVDPGIVHSKLCYKKRTERSRGWYVVAVNLED